jgi:hypothetical protein
MVPDRRTDDETFARLFSDHGDQTNISILMHISKTCIRRQLDVDDDEHPSDLHRAKRLVFAAAQYSDAKGAEIKAEIDGAYSDALRMKAGRLNDDGPTWLDVQSACLDVIRLNGRPDRVVLMKAARLIEEYGEACGGTVVELVGVPNEKRKRA